MSAGVNYVGGGLWPSAILSFDIVGGHRPPLQLTKGRRQQLARPVGDYLLQVISMAVNRNDGRKIPHVKLPNCFGTAELFKPNAQDPLDALRINLRCAANRVKINASITLARFLCPGSHATFTNHGFDAEPLDDAGLIRLLANRSCGSGREHLVAATRLQNDRTAMVDNSILDH